MLDKETRQTIRMMLDGESFEITDAKGAIRNLLTELDKAEEEIKRLHARRTIQMNDRCLGDGNL